MDARPVCPHCGQTLLVRPSGHLVCSQHGLALPTELLGPAPAARAVELATRGRQVGRRCPKDRLALSEVVVGGVSVEACMRCGSTWVPTPEADRLAAAAGVGSAGGDARATAVLSAVRAALGPVTPPRVTPKR